MNSKRKTASDVELERARTLSDLLDPTDAFADAGTDGVPAAVAGAGQAAEGDAEAEDGADPQGETEADVGAEASAGGGDGADAKAGAAQGVKGPAASSAAANADVGGKAAAPEPSGGHITNTPVEAFAWMPKKSAVALVMIVATMGIFVGLAVERFSLNRHRGDEAQARQARDKPAAATSEARRLEFPATPTTRTTGVAGERIPAVSPSDEGAEAIAVRPAGSQGSAAGRPKVVPPEDAPILLVTTRPGTAAPSRSYLEPPASSPGEAGAASASEPQGALVATSRNLQGYQRQLQGLLDSLTRTVGVANGQAAGPSQAPLSRPAPAVAPGGMAAGGLFGAQHPVSVSTRATASMLGNRSLTLPKGTAFTCALKTRVISANSGMVGCQVQRNVFSEDGRVLLIERGSHLDGEYQIASVRPGTVRIPLQWTRIRTPLGVTVDLDSPATGPLGESGIDGHVENRWGERIGAAMLLWLIDDSVKLVIQSQTASGHSDRQGDTVVLPSTTANTSKLAEKVLDSTINIPPLVYRNQGGIVGIYVARDVDFSSVYELKPTEGEPLQEIAR